MSSVMLIISADIQYNYLLLNPIKIQRERKHTLI